MSLAKWERAVEILKASPRQLFRLHHMLSYRLYFIIIVSFHLDLFGWCSYLLIQNRNRCVLMLARDCAQLEICFFLSSHSLDFQTMKQNKDKAAQKTEIKRLASIDSIPEDVALIIHRTIEEWAEVRGNHEERERGRK